MKFNKKILCLMLLLFGAHPVIYSQSCFESCNRCDCNCFCSNHCLYGKSFFCPRSQNTNVVREVVGHHLLRHRFDTDKFNLDFTITPQYGQSFKPIHMAQYFFSTDCIYFSGSLVPQDLTMTVTTQRPCYQFLADYFGLSPKFSGRIKIKPLVKTFLMDFDLYLGLDNLHEGLFFEINSPLVHTTWNMCICEEIFNSGIDDDFPQYYMDEVAVKPATTSIKRALLGGLTWGDIQKGITFGKIGCCCKTTKLADINMSLGYLFINRENGYVGLSLRTTAPTGTRSESCCLFEPIAGNCHHWELGLGFLGQVLIWEKDGDQTLYFHVNANFTHLFKSRQRRSFDFIKNGYYSRYTLLKIFDDAQNYTGESIPAINVTSLCCDVKIAFQADINLMFAYNNKNWEFDFGYNGWIRSREEICLLESLPKDKYGIKGIQNVAGGGENITQSCATIYGNQLVDQVDVADTIYPQFVNTCNLCIDSASTPKLLTHKLYWHLSHAWGDKTKRERIPYLGIGWQIEFESIKPRYMLPYKNAMYEWALWLKVGCSYG